ncbi:ribosomal 5S rRNA E-loop binding protein Ctc/L25/TL5 [Beutenbergia cavernae DSM 12333]|uniref:Large ribosomal subunit protein bL25 n=1 Tax=Beutenbergia cavernae (strain ATCC BAA-8 / DSM 12333 / CCUG 43141 / JCM 11478 / NBRC 16432 / NCIMB 13614 / HKI 0122) TaxID=471853 RepID=C5C064_BEUC1|nr:50S ribosomal protein L25/general stress protein Ctc [Beutenbergia cavernae]ACQ79250.1 ribosomal 5S rRNA E-loop binding protein Ctc/L25/TL5 [Beutenbergia cavernae DSM 12333]
MPESITATRRTEFGKGAARRLRRANQIPAVLYGHGTDPVHLSLPWHETFLALKGSANALLELSFDDASELALAKDVQRDPVKGRIEHLDLLLVRRGERVTVEVPIHVVGESAPGTIHTVDMQTLTVHAEATHLPEQITVDVEGLEDGTVVRVSDLVLPSGTDTDVDGEVPVVAISTPRASADDIAADEAAAEAGAEAGATAEGEDEGAEASDED